MEEQKDDNKKVKLEFSKLSLWKSISGIFGVLLVISILTGGFGVGSSDSGTDAAIAPAPSARPAGPVVVKGASIDDDPMLGDENAPVTIIEFSDFQCPFCRKFWTETLPSIKSQYIDTGKVRFVYRDFPLTSLHQQADRFAEAAECVRDEYGEEAFWKAHDEIYAQQNILDSGSREGPVRGTAQFTIEDVKSWLKGIGYNVDGCVDNRKFQNEVQKDLQDATAAGGRGTPYFVINGKPLSGAQPFGAFQQIIESEL